MNAQQSIFCTTAGPPFRSAKASMLTVSRAALPQNRRSSTSLQPATRKGCWCRPAHTAQPGSPAAQPSRRSASSHGPTPWADTLRSRAASTRSKKPSTTSTSGAPSSSAVPRWPAPCVSYHSTGAVAGQPPKTWCVETPVERTPPLRNTALTLREVGVSEQPLCRAQARSESGSENMMKTGLWNLGPP